MKLQRLEVIILSESFLMERDFANLLILAEENDSCEKLLLNDGSFNFPTPSFYETIASDAFGLGELGGQKLAELYRKLFSNLALPFTPHLSQDLLRLQIEQIASRLGDLEMPKLPTPTASSNRELVAHTTPMSVSSAGSEDDRYAMVEQAF